MSTKELREAAEQFRDSVYEESDEGHAQFRSDVRKLADAYLAEHPPDDDTPIDEAWLLIIEWVWIGNSWYPPPSQVPRNITEPIVFWHRVDGTLRLGSGSEWRSQFDATRGQLRRLCSALGIELKEEKE